MSNPFEMPEKAALSMFDVLAWIRTEKRLVSGAEVAGRFGISMVNACVRVARLHRMGYLRKSRQEVNRYEPTKFGLAKLKKDKR